MASTVTQPGAYDALEKAEPSEPMFPLLARDPCAAATITEWCRLRRMMAIRQFGDSTNPRDLELLAAELRQCANAEAVAMQMSNWRSEHTAVAGERASYQPVIKSAEEQAIAAKRHKREHMLKSLREAAYHLCEAKDAAADLGNEQAAGTFGSWEADVNHWADALQEQRPGARLPLEGPAHVSA